MPPKVKITKKMILESSFQIIRSEGYENLNARRIAECLECSTQPVLYQYKTMEEIREEVYQLADDYHTRYIMPSGKPDTDPLLELGLNYIRFGHEESNLFCFLFQTNKFGGLDVNSLMESPELSAIIEIVAGAVNCSASKARELFLTFFIVAHGYASLMANNAMNYDEEQAVKTLADVFDGLVASLERTTDK